MKWRLALTAWIVLAAGALAGEPSPEAAATIVLYNRNLAASRELAEYYAKQRDIPAAQLVGLPCSPEEEISREQYVVTIETPLRLAFEKFGWWRIRDDERPASRMVDAASMRFVAVMRGVPLKIASDVKVPPSRFAQELQPGSPIEMLLQHNEAAVDSELSAMFALREDLPAFVPNPYYRRFTPILQTAPGASPLLVCRLDGPSDAVVRRMIDDAIATERSGLWGWAYVDTRSISAPAYIAGDQWLNAAAEMMRRQGIPVITDTAEETFPEGFPMTDAALYYGWYANGANGPFTCPNFHFLPGAVAVHLHSYSGATLRDAKAAWAAPLLDRGAAATIGNVYEPFIELTVHFDVMQDRLMNGFTLAESAYAALRGLSWMTTVVGDPLYRPYARWVSMDEGDAAPNVWQEYRAVVLKAGGDPVAAADALRKLAVARKSSMPLEALGQAQAAAGRPDDALATLAAAAAMEPSRPVRFRLALEQIDILRHARRPDAARKRIAAALGDFPEPAAQTTLGRILLALTPTPTPAP